jgi:hypothetical protein
MGNGICNSQIHNRDSMMDMDIDNRSNRMVCNNRDSKDTLDYSPLSCTIHGRNGLIRYANDVS